jgi:ABC-2 type transport system permease protein
MNVFFRLLTHEMRLLTRSRVIAVVFLVLLPAWGFAAWNSQKLTQRIRQSVEAAMAENRNNRELWANAIDLRAAGKPTPEIPAWRDPTSPFSIGSGMGAIATRPPQQLAWLAVGESDVAPSTARINLTNRWSLFDHDEIVAPDKLALGNLDPAFVLVFILPLLVLMLSFDLIALERERGTLRMLRSAPVSLSKLLIGKALARGVFVTSLAFVMIAISTVLLVPSLGLLEPSSLVIVAISLSAYIAFWLGVSALLNTWRLSSSTLALISSAVWVLFTLFWPGVVKTTVSVVWPPPSRVAAIVELRGERVALEKQSDEILSAYLRDHPELAPKKADEWQRGFMLVQERLDQRLAPTHTRFSEQRMAQTKALEMANVLSPPSLFDGVLASIAGTDRANHDHFVAQATAFQRSWFAQIKEWTLQQKKLTASDVRALPSFQFNAHGEAESAVVPTDKPGREKKDAGSDPLPSMFKLLFMACMVWLGALFRARRADPAVIT